MSVKGFVEFIPWRGRLSEFYDTRWLSYDITKLESKRDVPGVGGNTVEEVYYNQDPAIPFSYSTDSKATAASKESMGWWSIRDSLSTLEMNEKAIGATIWESGNLTAVIGPETYVGNFSNGKNNDIVPRMHAYYDANNNVKVNIANRMIQKEALHHAQTGGFINIIVVQWADLMICKTRFLSIRQQGMVNPVMNFGLLFETILGSFFCYMPGISGTALGTRALRLSHWLSGIPFFCFIFMYDEIRKLIMRGTSPVNPKTKLR